MTALDNAPAHWTRTTIGEIADVSGGIQKQPSRKPRRNTAPFLRVANVQRGRLDLADVHQIELFDGELDRLRLAPGDMLVVEGNGSLSQIGRSALWNGEIRDCVHQNHLIRVRPGPDVLPRYLNWYWNSPLATPLIQAHAKTTSGLFTLSTSKVKSVPVALPSLTEQAEVIEAIERGTSRLSSLERSLHAGCLRCRALEGAVLAWLTASDTSTETTTLGQLLREPLKNGRSAKEAPDGRGVRTLTLTAVTQGAFTNDNTKLTSAEPERVSDLWLERDDLLIERANTPELVGTARRFAGPSDWAIFPDLVVRARVDTGTCDPRYIEMVLRSPAARAYYRQSARGGAGSMPKINQDVIRETPVALPPLPAQVARADRGAALLSKIEEAARTLARSESSCGRLEQSILTAAFSGRLHFPASGTPSALPEGNVA